MKINNLPLDFYTGVYEVDELTLLINDNNTPVNLIPYLEELRDCRINALLHEKSCDYSFQLNRLIYKAKNFGIAPEINYDFRSFTINDNYTLKLASWTHPVFEGRNFKFIYIKDQDNKIYFLQSDEYHYECLFDENQNLINSDKSKYYIGDILVSHVVYHLYQTSHGGWDKDKEHVFDYIVNHWNELKSDNYYGKTFTGREAVKNHFRNIPNLIK